MKTLEYVKEHHSEFEHDNFCDRRWTKRFIDFLPAEEWEKYGFRPTDYLDREKYQPKEWTEANILEQLKKDVEFGYEKSVGERGISSELMAMVVRSWCEILENGLALSDYDDGYYHIRQFEMVADYYGWELG